jgi:asparagine synthase (glutamine-hydrolysing)
MEFLAKKFLAGLHVHPVLRHQRWLGSFLPEDLPELLGEDDAAAQSRLEALLVGPAAAALDPLEALLATDRRFYLQDQTLVKVDRASMARALEVRVPLLARAVVAFARSLPAERKLHGRSTKVILRELARRRGLPPSIVDRPKKGFGIPLSRWFRADLRELLCDSLSPGRLEKDGLFRAPAVQRLLAEHLSGRRDHRKKLFNLLTFVLWRDSALASEGAVA